MTIMYYYSDNYSDCKCLLFAFLLLLPFREWNKNLAKYTIQQTVKAAAARYSICISRKKRRHLHEIFQYEIDCPNDQYLLFCNST